MGTCCSNCFGCYSRCVSKRPVLSFLAALAVFLLLTVAGFALSEFDFGDAGAGFEPRGTYINSAKWNNDNLECWPLGRDIKEDMCNSNTNGVQYASGRPAARPLSTTGESFVESGVDAKSKRRITSPATRLRRRPALQSRAAPAPSSGGEGRSAHERVALQGGVWGSSDPAYTGACLAYGGSSGNDMSYAWRIDSSGDTGQQDLPYIVFKATGTTALEVDALKQMCAVDDALRTLGGNFRMQSNAWYTGNVYNEPDGKCYGRSVAGWAATWGAVNCDSLTAEHVANFTARLQACAPYYASETLTDSSVPTAGSVPTSCDVGPYAANGAYDVFRHLAHSQYLDPAQTTAAGYSNLQYAKLIVATQSLSEDEGVALFDILDSGYQGTTSFGGYTGLKITSFWLGNDVKDKLFSDKLITDSYYAVAASVCVFIILCVYTRSLFVGGFGFLQVILSFTVSNFIYHVIFQMPFFPFLNMIAIYVILGIGADDIFVFVDAWKQSFSTELGIGPAADDAQRMAWTLKRAGSATLVTSLSTGAAFYASALSDITAIRCFAIFSGTLVLVDWLMMMLYLPAVVIIGTRCCARSMCCCGRKGNLTPGRDVSTGESSLTLGVRCWRNGFAPILTKWYMAVLTLALALALNLPMSYKATISPTLELPTSSEIQLFVGSHPLEIYDITQKKLFASGLEQGKMRAAFYFGIENKETGDPLDPYDKSTYSFNSDFDPHSMESQTWLYSFCNNMSSSPYYYSAGYTQCFQTNFLTWLNDAKTQGCSSSAGRGGSCTGSTCFSDVCCSAANHAIGSIVPSTHQTCLVEWVRSNGNYDGINLSPIYLRKEGVYICPDDGTGNGCESLSGVDVSNNKVVAIQITQSTSLAYTQVYDTVETFWDAMKTWGDAYLLEGTPTGMAGGWFSSDVDFYDLQSAIASGAYSSAGFSLLFAFCILLATNRNILLTLLAITTIFLTITTVVGCLVVDGWELSITESITLSIAAGMSVDFTAHFAHAYSTGASHGADTRVARVTVAMAEMGASLTAAALTTFVSGCFMMLATVLFYFQFGMFLMLTMTIGLFNAVFLFLPVLVLIGDTGNWFQLDAHCKSKQKAAAGHTITVQPGATGGQGPEAVEMKAAPVTAQPVLGVVNMNTGNDVGVVDL